MVDGHANLHLPMRTARTTVHQHKATVHYRNIQLQTAQLFRSSR